MALYEPPHQDLRCLQIQLFSSLVFKELKKILRKCRSDEGLYSVVIAIKFVKVYEKFWVFLRFQQGGFLIAFLNFHIHIHYMMTAP